MNKKPKCNVRYIKNAMRNGFLKATKEYCDNRGIPLPDDVAKDYKEFILGDYSKEGMTNDNTRASS